MKSSTTSSFRRQYGKLPRRIRRRARNQFRLWKENPDHPSLRFRRVGKYWSVRVDASHRALGIKKDDEIVWFFIGAHDGYERKI